MLMNNLLGGQNNEKRISCFIKCYGYFGSISRVWK
nr:MAG TPA: hypothetical protein [Bacteriophage sp.]